MMASIDDQYHINTITLVQPNQCRNNYYFLQTLKVGADKVKYMYVCKYRHCSML